MLPSIAWVAIAFAVGIAGQQSCAAPAWALGIALGASLTLLWFTWLTRRYWGLAVLLQAVILGGFAASLAVPRAAPGLLAEGGREKPWRIVARVVETPQRMLGNVHVLLSLEEVMRAGAARSAGGLVWLRLGGNPSESLLPGDRVVWRSLLHEPRGLAEPDSADAARRLAERGVIAVAGVPDPGNLVRLAGEEQNSLMRWIAAARNRLLKVLQTHLTGDRRALVESLVLGERGDVSLELDDAFRLSGVTHVLSVSGLHLAIAAFLFYVGLRRILLLYEPLARRVDVRRIAAVAALPAVLFYTLLTGAQVATVRSCIVAGVWLTAAALVRPPHAGAALALAALGILGAAPLALYDPSFQLSFAAAIGGIVLVPRIVTWHGKSASWPGRLGRMALGIGAASLAATLATAPISAWHFAQIAPAGLLTNIVVVPLAEMWVLPVGLAACAVAALCAPLAGPLFWLAGLGAGAMAWVTRHVALLPGVETLRHVPVPTLLEAALWYAMLLVVVLAGWRAWKYALICLLIWASLLGGRILWPRLHPTLTVTFLDVGQGDACFIRFPDGKTLMVDGGGSASSTFDPGAQVIAPWLVRQGVARLDVLVMSHPHPDHINGLASLVERFPVGEIWTMGAPADLPAWQRLSASARARGIPLVAPHDGAIGGAELEVLAPSVGGQVQLPAGWSENDASLVLRLRYGGRAVLLPGDIEARGEMQLLSEKRPIHADVLKAPHHGSRTSSSTRFIAEVAPSLVVFSVGAHNAWGFPVPEVVERYRQNGAVVVRIDQSGHIAVTTARAM